MGMPRHRSTAQILTDIVKIVGVYLFFASLVIMAIGGAMSPFMGSSE